ncbi:MAG: aromatic amino acid lyase [Pseudomonadota bacterium]
MTAAPPFLALDGRSLTCESLEAASHGRPQITLAPEGLARMAASRAIIEDRIARKIPVYGITTGLGALAGTALGAEELKAYSYQTIRGRAHAAGDLQPAEQVRAALLARLNTLLLGASGARPELAEGLKTALEAGLTPAVGTLGSIGAGDLIMGATSGLALIGEGAFLSDDGSMSRPSAEVFAEAGVDPVTLGPRDGLALANHAGFSAGLSALGLTAAARALAAADTAAALSMEGFGANLSPFDDRVIALRGQPGEAEAAARLRSKLDGSALPQPGTARRLQDPLSIRNIPQVHGLVIWAIGQARTVIETELNGSSDNPAALTDAGEILSTGNYLTPHLTSAAEGLSRALVHMATAQVARLSVMLANRFTDLPLFLAKPGSTSSGFAPVMKVAEAILAELTAAAAPAPLWSSLCADGVEDVMASSFSAANALMRSARLASRLSAIELMVGAQAVELRTPGGPSAPALRTALEHVRRHSAALGEDRPLGEDINRLTEAIAREEFP